MSRNQPNPQNQQTLRALSRVEANRQCADCKRNKHPRWASWNLGIFVCIRCSGIHRGMGTHISRVKSVDLDAWTDEQTQQMLRWGNARANKYWESKLAPGHIPAEAKIENFIRTKYESKRWAMDGGIPDPATLDDTGGDDEVPLNVVQEKAKLDRSASLKAASISSQPASLPAPTQNQSIDLFGDDQPQSIARPHTTAPPTSIPAAPVRQEAPPPKPARAADSLLGFDFFGSTSSEPSRPSSAAPSHASTGSISRPDLKQSILSLYANTPKATAPAAAPPSTYHQRNDSNPLTDSQPPGFQASPSGSATQASLDDAFSGLSFTANNAKPTQATPRPSAFSDLKQTSFRSSSKQNPQPMQNPLSGGSFFDTKPNTTSRPADNQIRQMPNYASPVVASHSRAHVPSTVPAPAAATSTSKHVLAGDLLSLDFSSPPAMTTSASNSRPLDNSPFNLSAQKASQGSSIVPTASNKSATVSGTTASAQGFASLDPWGSSDVWSASQAPPNAVTAVGPPPAPNNSANVWGDDSTQNRNPPQGVPTSSTVTADEDFGGWAKSPPGNSSVGSSQPKPLTGFNEDLFSNVWE